MHGLEHADDIDAYHQLVSMQLKKHSKHANNVFKSSSTQCISMPKCKGSGEGHDSGEIQSVLVNSRPYFLHTTLSQFAIWFNQRQRTTVRIYPWDGHRFGDSECLESASQANRPTHRRTSMYRGTLR
jgi:hypothetical protein